MVDHTSGVQRSVKVRGKDLNGKVVVLDKTFPNQLTLFQTFLPEEDPEDKYSNGKVCRSIPHSSFLIPDISCEFSRENKHGVKLVG
jgi:hypothetical protein